MLTAEAFAQYVLQGEGRFDVVVRRHKSANKFRYNSGELPVIHLKDYGKTDANSLYSSIHETAHAIDLKDTSDYKALFGAGRDVCVAVAAHILAWECLTDRFGLVATTSFIMCCLFIRFGYLYKTIETRTDDLALLLANTYVSDALVSHGDLRDANGLLKQLQTHYRKSRRAIWTLTLFAWCGPAYLAYVSR